MDETTILGSASEGRVKHKSVKRVSWIKRNTTKILWGIIGVFAFSLLSVTEAWWKENQVRTRQEGTLNWLAKEHQKVRNERDFYSQIADDLNYYRFIKAVYEAKDRDGFFETISIVYEESKRAEINPWETMSIIQQESGFKPEIVSLIWKKDKDGNMEQVPCAYGLMQINYNAWKEEKGLTLKNIFNKRLNVRTGLEIYKYYLMLARGDKFLALFYYNNGTVPRNPNHDYAPAVMGSKFMKMADIHELIDYEKVTGISQ